MADGLPRVIPSANAPRRRCAADGRASSDVPKKLQGSEHDLEDALAALGAGLNQSGASWMVIGGIAIIARGVRRFTTDIDVVVRGDAIVIERLVDVLAEHSIAPRIQEAVSFARANLVLLMRHTPTGVDLDVSLAWSAFEHAALVNSSTEAFGRAHAPMASAEDLVVLKAIAGRPRDAADVESLSTMFDALIARVRD